MARGEGPEEHQPRSTDALWERVRGLGTDMQTLAETTAGQFRDLRAEVNTSVGNVAALVERLGTKIETNQATAAERSRPQYLALFAGIISAIGVSVTVIQWQESQRDKPVDEKLTALTAAISDLTRNTAASFGEAAKSTISRTEFDLATKFRDKMQDVATAFRDKQVKDLEDRIGRVEGVVVPRSEFAVRWENEATTDKRLQDEIDTVRREAELKQHELELRVYGGGR